MTQATETAAADLERRALLPGRRVEIPELELTVIVHPIGWKHFLTTTKSLGALIGSVIKSAPQIAAAGDRDPKAMGGIVIGHIMPFVTEELLTLIEACITLEPKDATLDNVPHWAIAEIIEAWTEESFGEEKKWRPWITAIEKTVQAFTGKSLSIKEIFSKLSSPQGTPEPTSSTGGK